MLKSIQAKDSAKPKSMGTTFVSVEWSWTRPQLEEKREPDQVELCTNIAGVPGLHTL